MGKVAITFNINLDSPEVDAETVKSTIEKMDGFESAEIKPLAFGMKQIAVLFTFDDKVGADTDTLQKKLEQIDGIANAETGDVTLL
tara:strand:- start:329 stop:586 length:258 start_codon:yes stop_codon:yes gene_type:complete